MTLPERLEALAKAVEGDQWEEPCAMADALWLAAKAINQFVPLPEDISGYDDDSVPEWAAVQVSLACKVWDVDVPEHIREALEADDE